MKSLCLMVNALEEFTFAPLVREILPGCKATVSETFPAHPGDFDLIVLWSVRKIVPQAAGCRNAMVFHSSDLPEGKGWAPIYHAIADGQARYTVTGLLPVQEADAGEIVVKASFAIRPEHTAAHLRRFDERITLLLAGQVMERFPAGGIRGAAQTGPGSYRPRRKPQDNEIDLDRPFRDLIPHLRACEPSHPAFFHHQGVRYDVSVAPAAEPVFPADLRLEWGA